MNGTILKVIGVVCLLFGMWLFIRGHDVADSIGSQITLTITGASSSKATHYYLASAAVAVLGGFLIFWKGKKA